MTIFSSMTISNSAYQSMSAGDMSRLFQAAVVNYDLGIEEDRRHALAQIHVLSCKCSYCPAIQWLLDNPEASSNRSSRLRMLKFVGYR